MSFGALSAWQAWLFIAVAGAVAVWVFNLKVRPPRQRVPSLMMWGRVLAAVRELSWWERVRRVVSRVVTVCVAVALAAAIMRPGPRVAAGSASRVFIVLDSSWSMSARSPRGGTRWDHAVAEAKVIARSASGDVALATTADGLVEGPTTDAALIETALDRLEPSGGDAAAFPQTGRAEAVHFITDGAVARTIDGGVIVHSVYDAAPNVAITAFDTRPSVSAAGRAQAYLEISNFSPARQTAHVTVTRDATVVLDRQLDMAPGDVARQILTLDAAGGPRLLAHVSGPDDAIEVDDDAVAWLATADVVEVMLVSDAPGTIAGLLQRDPGVHIRVVPTASYQPAADADLVVFDRWLPPAPAAHPMLLIAPPSASWLGTAGAVEDTPRWASVAPHPILSGVDPLLLGLTRVTAYSAEGLTPVASSARQTPIIGVQDRADRRLAILAFPVDARISGAPAFPVLIGNVVEWLARPAGGPPRPTGPIALPLSTSRVTSPEGKPVALVRTGDGVLATLPRPGLYLVTAGGSRSVVAVNVGAPDVSNAEHTTLPPSASRNALVFANRPWWMYAIVLSFVLLAAEWWTWQQRVTV